MKPTKRPPSPPKRRGRTTKAFGEKSTAAEQGFDLQTIVGWLEDMITDEEERGHPLVPKAYDALQLLTEIADGLPFRDGVHQSWDNKLFGGGLQVIYTMDNKHHLLST